MTTLTQIIKEQYQLFDIVGYVDLDQWYDFDYSERAPWLLSQVKELYRDTYADNQRLLFVSSKGDEYQDDTAELGEIVKTLQMAVNKIDVSNFFVTVIMPANCITPAQQVLLEKISVDPVPMRFLSFETDELFVRKKIVKKVNNTYDYNSRMPIDIDINNLGSDHKKLLLQSDKFCIYPWVHLFVSPNGDTYPCCGYQYDHNHVAGNTTQNTLKQIWNSEHMRTLRLNMLNETPSSGCRRCYEQEQAGFFSMRNSANKHHGKHISRVDNTQPDGTYDDFAMIYWDVRFNNLCNLRCRSCGPQFSSSWYQDQKAIAPDYDQRALIFAGKFETDLWEQLIEHIDYVEQIYFAGGEPLMMDEHYRILEELESRGKWNVRLIYNTNFTVSKLGKRSVFDYWRRFQHVAVGASLDASGSRAEYIRKGTVWSEVESNRRQMLEICPQVDFYISATLSVMNAWHLPDFHREWVDKGLIGARDFNINNLTNPDHYRIDILPTELKQQIEKKYLHHMEWLNPLDDLRRAYNGFQSAINFMNAKDNSNYLDKFRAKTQQLDLIRGERMCDILPELSDIL